MKKDINKIRHSLSHIMAAAVSEFFPGVKFGIGPAIENGFYYDFDSKPAISEGDLPRIEKRMKELIKQNAAFKRKLISKAEAKKIFKNQPYKLELIKDLPSKQITIYETYQPGSKNKKIKPKTYFIDLCAGPHIKNTKEINPEAFKLRKIAGAYWKGDEKNPMLARIYGLAFETKDELNEYLEMLVTAEKCDHRILGERLEYFMLDEEIGKGLPLWLPKGHFIRHKLEEYMYELEQKNGYQHVLTPILAKEDLYKKSGHLDHYQNDMYAPIEIEKEKYYLKPMNCPHHHSIYKHHKRSYRELPLRLAEFGLVHRFERSGVLSGLMRVRGFTQNDSHIYTNEEHLEKEIIGVLKLIEEVYAVFGIKDYWYRLSLPDFKNKEKYGDIKNKKMWERGSADLTKALKETGHKFMEAPGEATFYGPKIDIQIKDIWGREDTLSTIQVDYYSAPRFNIYYVDKESKEQPAVIIHRAIMGSFDRFFAFLLEKTCGNLPLWLTPIQAEIINVGSAHRQYAELINRQLKANNIRTELSDENQTVSKRIREAEIQKIPYILVVGDRELANNSVNVRSRKGNEGEINLEKLIERIGREIAEKTV